MHTHTHHARAHTRTRAPTHSAVPSSLFGCNAAGLSGRDRPYMAASRLQITKEHMHKRPGQSESSAKRGPRMHPLKALSRTSDAAWMRRGTRGRTCCPAAPLAKANSGSWGRRDFRVRGGPPRHHRLRRRQEQSEASAGPRRARAPGTRIGQPTPLRISRGGRPDRWRVHKSHDAAGGVAR